MHTDLPPDTTVNPRSGVETQDEHIAYVASIGLKSALDPAISWAAKLGLEGILLSVIFASNTHKQVDYFGTIFHFLTEPTALKYIKHWATELACGDELLKLCESASLNPLLHLTYPALPTEKPAEEQLKGGDLGAYPLVALLLRPIPGKDEGNREWLGALRVWLFLQLVDSIYLRVFPNPLLTEVISKLRLGIDIDPNWLVLFNRLRVNTNSFLGIKRDLALMSRALSATTKDPIQRQSHLTLLSSLIRLCKDDSPEINASQFGSEYGTFLTSLNRTFGVETPSGGFNHLTTLWQFPDLDAPQTEEGAPPKSINFDSKDNGNSNLIASETDEFELPAEQELKGLGVLLSTIEDHQYLPFSWNRLSKDEKATLTSWMIRVLTDAESAERLLASYVYLAIHTAYSLETVVDIPFETSEKGDWHIDLKNGMLICPSPRRRGGWKALSEHLDWIEPLDSILSFTIDPSVLLALRYYSDKAQNCTDLRSLWFSLEVIRPSTKFDRICRHSQGMERIRSGMLSGYLKQGIYESTSDPVLSDLLSSHPESGLPGACAYSAYSNNSVANTLNLIGIRISPAVDSSTSIVETLDTVPKNSVLHNAAGSQLSTLDSAINKACDDAFKKIQTLALKRENWIAHHNAVTAYVVVILLSATGARPVTSPFESIKHFDWDLCAVFVEDKVSSRLHQGRLVPIPEWVCQLVRVFYLEHLKRISTLLSTADPSFSSTIAAMADGKPSPNLPLFFILSETRKLRWVEVSESSLAALDLFTWPLPWNLMRHRLPTQLKRDGHNSEIINGITGHGESGTDSYGEYSTRCWLDDAQSSANILEATLNRLNFQTPRHPTWDPSPVEQSRISSTDDTLRIDMIYGAKARTQRRAIAHQQAQAHAITEIEKLVNGRNLESLSPHQWEEISLEMLFHKDGRPRTYGSIRYEALNTWIRKNWKEKGLRPRIKRRYIPVLEESSPFSSTCIHAIHKVDAALGTLREYCVGNTISRESNRSSLILGILHLLLHSRVADMSVISDLSKNRNYRLVKFGHHFYIEHSPGLGKITTLAVRRYRLNALTAEYLAKAKASKISINVSSSKLKGVTLGIARNLSLYSEGMEFHKLISDLAIFVQQSNNIIYSGLVAGYLNGDVISVGLSHSDWIRCLTGRCPIIPTSIYIKHLDHKSSKASDSDENGDETLLVNEDEPGDYLGNLDLFSEYEFVGPKSKPILQKAAHDFFSSLRSHLLVAEARNDDFRKTLDSNIKSTILENKGRVSISCLLLGEWLRNVIWRRIKTGYVEISSIRRYLTSLSPCFESVAYEHDLAQCDEDEVTKFYLDIMEVRRFVREHVAINADLVTDQKDTVEVSPRHLYRTQQLAFQLLKDFHKFVSKEYVVDDPDWSEIQVDDALLSISPGMMTETEYLHCLKRLISEPKDANRVQLASGFILLVAFRFGLRGREITGLLRRDWIEGEGGSVVILVRGNRFRTLKTSAAQRKVPLMFVLAPIETQLLENWFASFEGITSLDLSSPLYADESNPRELMNEKLLRWQVSSAMKTVTQNRDLSLHHARHSFLNSISLLLIDNCETIWPQALSASNFNSIRKSHVRKLLLCTDGVTRRSIWAIARCAGHAHPRTSVKSYLHILPDLSEQAVHQLPNGTHKPSLQLLACCIDLDSIAYNDDYLLTDQVEPQELFSRQPSAQQCIHFLRLSQKGVKAERAEFATKISRNVARDLIYSVVDVDEILQANKSVNPKLSGRFNLLSHLTPARWDELISRTHLADFHNPIDSSLILPISEIGCMVGVTRQILLWKQPHFSFFKRMLKYWSLTPHSYTLEITKIGRDRIQNYIKTAGIDAGINMDRPLNLIKPSPVKPKKPTKKSKFYYPRAADFQQIDTVHLEDVSLKVSHRCGVVTQTHLESQLRTSYEMVLLLIVTIVLEFHLST